MSRVYFHTPAIDAELRGSERAWCRSLVNDIAIGLLGAGGFRAREQFTPLIAPGHYLQRATDAGWQMAFETAWGSGDMLGGFLAWRGHPLDPFTISLNTAVAIGNDAIKLAARVHAQCEIHAWVDGTNRTWLADIIDGGLAGGIFRPETQGWEEVAELLRSGADDPVVMSSSHCDQFPHEGVGGWMPGWPEGLPKQWSALTPEQQVKRSARQDEWYGLDDDRKWQIAMAALRADTESGLELRPDNWNSFRFGDGLTVFDLTASDRDERLTAVFGPAETSQPAVDLEEIAESIRRVDEYYSTRHDS